jgi:hypothetical protein
MRSDNQPEDRDCFSCNGSSSNYSVSGERPSDSTWDIQRYLLDDPTLDREAFEKRLLDDPQLAWQLADESLLLSQIALVADQFAVESCFVGDDKTAHEHTVVENAVSAVPANTRLHSAWQVAMALVAAIGLLAVAGSWYLIDDKGPMSNRNQWMAWEPNLISSPADLVADSVDLAADFESVAASEVGSSLSQSAEDWMLEGAIAFFAEVEG